MSELSEEQRLIRKILTIASDPDTKTSITLDMRMLLDLFKTNTKLTRQKTIEEVREKLPKPKIDSGDDFNNLVHIDWVNQVLDGMEKK